MNRVLISRIGSSFRKPDADTLVVYDFQNTDALDFDNLKFFMEWAMEQDDGCFYVFIVGASFTAQKVSLSILQQ